MGKNKLRKQKGKLHKITFYKLHLLNSVVLVTLILYLSACNTKNEYSGIMDLYSNRSISYNNGTVEYLTIIANKSEISDQEECAWEVIEHCLANDFPTIMFSYHLNGYPCEINASVYLTKEDVENGEPVFKMTYKQDAENNYKYNIKDNPEKFSLKIE